MESQMKTMISLKKRSKRCRFVSTEEGASYTVQQEYRGCLLVFRHGHHHRQKQTDEHGDESIQREPIAHQSVSQDNEVIGHV